MKQKTIVDYKSLVAQADFYYDKPVEQRYQGMPIGNGRTGSMVWTEEAAIGLQINRVDVFSTNGATGIGEYRMDSPDYLGAKEYCGGCSFFQLDFQRPVFTKEDTSQHLSVYDATLALEGKNIVAQIKVWSEQDVFVIDISDTRAEKTPIKITLSMLREAHVVNKNHRADSKVFPREQAIYLTQEFSEACDTGIIENDHYCASCVIATGNLCELLDCITDAESQISMTLSPQSSQYQIYISSGASFASVEDATKKADKALQLAQAASAEKIHDSHIHWWHDYWSKSFINTPGNSDFTLYWYTYLYYIGSTMRGDYPAKFNGLLFNCDGDIRSWGGQFWWYNQSRSHYGLDIANHGDMNDPLKGFLLRNITKYQTACQQQFGGQGGIYLPETEGYSGPEILPESIAADLKTVILDNHPASKALLDFMKHRSGMNSRWSLFYSQEHQKREDVQSFRWHSNLSYNAGDVANSFWNHYLYTMDETVLREIYPWLKGVAEFYRHHPRLVLEDEYYHIDSLGWAESITSAKDVIDDLVIMKGIYPTVLTAARILQTDQDLLVHWEDMLAKIPPYPTSDMSDSVSNKYHKDGFTTYAIGREPSVKASDGNVNDCRLRMLFSFDLVNLETKCSHPEEWRVAQNSFDSLPVTQLLKKGEPTALKGIGHGWNRALVKAARLGRSDLVFTGLPGLLNQFKYANYGGAHVHYPNRLPWSNGKESYSIQEMGVFSDQLQEPLLQSIANGAGSLEHVIHVFPAWPREWDASFQLRAKGAFMVQATLENRIIQQIVISSEAGRICRVHNPWPEDIIEVWNHGKRVLESGAHTIVFETAIGEEYRIVKQHHTSGDDFSKILKAERKIFTDQCTVTTPLYDGVATIAPNEKTKLFCEGNVSYRSTDDSVVSVLQDNIIVGKRLGVATVFAMEQEECIGTVAIKVAHPVINDGDRRIVYSHGWKHEWYTQDGSYYDDYHYTETENAFAEIIVQGTGIEVFGLLSPQGGTATMEIDGEVVTEIDCFSPERLTNQLLYRNLNLEQKTHTVRITSMTNKPCYLDYFRILSE